MSEYTIKDFKTGQRVQLHPATNAWMRGDKYGSVAKVGRKLVHVRMDKSKRTISVGPANIYQIFPAPVLLVPELIEYANKLD